MQRIEPPTFSFVLMTHLEGESLQNETKNLPIVVTIVRYVYVIENTCNSSMGSQSHKSPKTRKKNGKERSAHPCITLTRLKRDNLGRSIVQCTVHYTRTCISIGSRYSICLVVCTPLVCRAAFCPRRRGAIII